MPAKSKAQQRFFGMVSAYKAGKLKTSKLNKKFVKKIKKTAEDMKAKDIKDFAETKTKGLPKKLKKENNIIKFDNFINEKSNNIDSTAYAFVPDENKPSTWKLRIDDENHVKSAVAALDKGFRGNKVKLPSDKRDIVIDKVRKAYKKFFPNKELPKILKESLKEIDIKNFDDFFNSGYSKNKSDDNFDENELKKGTEIQQEEHGGEKEISKKIAKDHLTEHPLYYDDEVGLKNFERELDKIEKDKTGRKYDDENKYDLIVQDESFKIFK